MDVKPLAFDGNPLPSGGYTPDWGKPYSPATTLGIGICIFTLTHYAVWISSPLFQTVLAPLLMADVDMTSATPNVDLMLRQGLFHGIGGCVMGVVGGLLLALAVVLSDAPARAYFGCGKIRLQQTVLFVAVSVLFFVLFWTLTRPIYGTSDYWGNLYRSAQPLAWLWLGLGVLGPIYEELFYRGFFYTGLRQTVLGIKGTIVASALLFAASHFQYGVLGMMWIFVLGLLFGIARHRSDTVRLPILMHMAYNLVFLGFCDASV